VGRKYRLQIVLVLFLLVFAPVFSAETVNRDLFDRYCAAYQNYQDAIAKNLPIDEIKAKLEEYLQAKAAYEGSAKAEKPSETKSSELISDNSLPAENPSSQQPSVVATDGQTISTSISGSSGLSAELQAILNELWTPAGANKSDSAIKKLEVFVKSHSPGLELARAKYELAKAYEWLKKDKTAAAQILKEIAAGPYGFISTLAQDRLKVYNTETQHGQWKSVLEAKEKAMEESYKTYRETSWLAFPVKIGRYCTYVGKLLSFDKAQEDYKNFQISFEEAAAKFMPPPEIVFDMFKVPTSNTDPEGRVRLVYSNSEAWYSRWKLLNEARRSIDIQYFIVASDIFGMSLTGVLLKKAKEGVKIRFMMDARGTKGFTRKLLDQDYMQQLARFPNVEIKVFNPVHQNLATMFLDIRKFIASDHDKIIVVDEEYSIVGGSNISKDYFVDPEDHPTAYRDCDVVIHSPEVAKALSLAFSEEFMVLKSLNIGKDIFGKNNMILGELETAWEAMNSFLHGGKVFKAAASLDSVVRRAVNRYNEELAKYKHLIDYADFDPMEGAHECPIKIIDKHSVTGFRNDITDQVVRFIDGAKEEIIIQNPYVVLTERAEAALKRAAKRGVKILMHTNSPVSTDSLATQAMFYADWKRILKEIPTMRIFVFTGQRKLHAKTFIFDKKVSIIGTYNMDYISEEVNSEVVAAIKSKEFCAEHRAGIMADIAQSKEYKIQVNSDGSVESVFGPDDLKTSKSWMIKLISKLKFLKPII